MKRITKYVLILLLAFAVGYLVSRVTADYNEKNEAEKRIRLLPNVAFISLNGNPVNLHEFDQTKPLVIVYFHPECEHCQYEAQEIGQNANAFKTCQMVMITYDDSIKRVENLCRRNNLWEVDNIEILFDTENQFKKVFGKAVIPSVYIYDVDRKLKKRFFGETKPEAIIRELKNATKKDSYGQI